MVCVLLWCVVMVFDICDVFGLCLLWVVGIKCVISGVGDGWC